MKVLRGVGTSSTTGGVPDLWRRRYPRERQVFEHHSWRPTGTKAIPQAGQVIVTLSSRNGDLDLPVLILHAPPVA